MTLETREHARWGSLVPIVGIRVLSAITQKAWTVAGTARMIGIAQQTLDSIVRGTTRLCRLTTRADLATALKVSPSWLSGGPPIEALTIENPELQLELISCSTRAHRFQFALGQVFSKSALNSHDLNEILSAALSLEEAIAKMYAASGVAPSRSAAGG